MYLFYDTETTGIFNKKLPMQHPDQPRIVQLATSLCEEGGAEVAGFNILIHHEGLVIPDGAAAVHGITVEKTIRYGFQISGALKLFFSLLGRATRAIGHNEEFDFNMICREVGDTPFFPTRECTADLSINDCKLPPTERMLQYSFTGYKRPKLSEAYRHYFGRDFEGAHNAMCDVNACKEIYFEIKSRDAVTARKTELEGK